MLVLVVGPSGAGKDTLMAGAAAALADDARFRFVRRAITRGAEAGGEAHLAVTASAFGAVRAAGGYALAWEAHGLGYGIPADIAGDLAAGRVVVANVSRGVVAEAAERFAVRVLLITAPADVLARRLAERGREGAEDVARRLARAVEVAEGAGVVTVVNDAGVAEGVAKVVGMLRGCLGEGGR